MAASADLSVLAQGQKLHAQFSDGQWYLAEVIEVSTLKRYANAPVKVRYMGHGEELDEWVGVDRLRSKLLRPEGDQGEGKGQSKGRPAKAKPAAGGAAANSSTNPLEVLEKGMRLQAQFSDGEWYVAEIVNISKAKKSTPVQVHFMGYGEENDAWLGLDRLRSKALKAVMPQADGQAPAPKAKAKAKAPAAPALPSSGSGGPPPGTRVHAQYKDGTWYRATVVECSLAKKHADAPVKVHYVDFGPEADEWVSTDRLWPAVVLTAPSSAVEGSRTKAASNPLLALPVGTTLQAQGADGTWYVAEVLQVSPARNAAPIKVRYTGHGPELDEWLGQDRLRSKLLKAAKAEPLSSPALASKGKRYRAQLEALQGQWVEEGRPTKIWFVEENKARLKGKPRKYPLNEGPNGDLIWGTGTYVLDRNFRAASHKATWVFGETTGSVAFAWVREA